VLVEELITALRAMGGTHVRVLQGVTEDVVFPMPKGLGRAAA
jgi:hypothetical protein